MSNHKRSTVTCVTLAVACLGSACTASNDSSNSPTSPAQVSEEASAVRFSKLEVSPRGEKCSGSIARHAAILSNGFGFDRGNRRNQNSEITSGNVTSLELAFTHAALGATGKRGAPAVTEQVIYFSGGREITAIDRLSGCTYWSYSAPQRSAGELLGENTMRSSTVYLLDESLDKPALVLAGDAIGHVYAVDAITGALVWERFVGDDPRHHWITGGFQYYDGKLFVPFSSREVITAAASLEACCSTHGLLRAIDPYSGATIWSYETTPAATFSPLTTENGPSGAGIWSVPAIDTKRNLVYIGTGQNYSHPVTGTSDAIIALELDTGRPRWIFQARDDDAWNASCEIPEGLDFNCSKPVGYDFDFGAPPVLVEQAVGSDVVLAADKGGSLYSIDPESGRLNWSRRLGKGSALGGVHWGLAVDQTRVYVAVADAFVDKTSVLAGDLLALLGGNISLPIEPIAGGNPGLYAVDILTGELIWYVQTKHIHQGKEYVSIYSAALTVTNDVLFAGALDGELAAFSTVDGTELWRVDTDIAFVDVNGVEGEGGTIDSVGAVPVVDMLLLNTGYDNFGGVDAYQAGSGNGLFVFQLKK